MSITLLSLFESVSSELSLVSDVPLEPECVVELDGVEPLVEPDGGVVVVLPPVGATGVVTVTLAVAFAVPPPPVQLRV